MPETIASRPLPRRPETGLLAWQATIGYMSTQHSPDAMLTIQVYPMPDASIAWAAAVNWGAQVEQVADRASLPDTLRDLWRVLDQNHVIFESKEALLKRPTNYADHEWLDTDTQSILDRLIFVSQAVYGFDWLLVLVYQPVESPNTRCQVRLLALQNSVQTAGQGGTMRDACHALYLNAARYFMSHSGKRLEDIV
jgi:hypothetical protein